MKVIVSYRKVLHVIVLLSSTEEKANLEHPTSLSCHRALMSTMGELELIDGKLLRGLPQWLSGKESACNAGVAENSSSIPELGRSPRGGHGNPLQYPGWRIPWTEELGRLQFMGLQRVGHNWNDLASVQFSSVAQLCPTLRPHELQHARPPCPSPTPGVHSDLCPSSQWCHPAIPSSVVPFSSYR